MKKIKINVVFELEEVRTVENSSYPEELLKNDLIHYLRQSLERDYNDELYIDLSDDGEGEYNIYNIKVLDPVKPISTYCVEVTREVEGMYIFHFQSQEEPTYEQVLDLVYAEDICFNPKYEKFRFFRI